MQHIFFCAPVLLVIVGLVQAQDCTVDPASRVDCGYGGITQADCEGKGCCFNSDTPGTKWCFYNLQEAPAREAECIVDPALRKECGYPGITDKECRGYNCCYDESIPEVVWCFKKAEL